MMVAHDHDVRSTAGPRLQAGRDGLDQIHDRFAHHYPIAFTQVSHVDRPRFIPRPPDQLLNFGFVGPDGSPPLLAPIFCSHRCVLSSPPSSLAAPVEGWAFCGLGTSTFEAAGGAHAAGGRRRGILFSEAFAVEGVVVFAKACELGLEGIVSKRQGSFYKSGRSRNWLKTINPEFVRT
jgi:hypothetical protein